MKCHALKKKLLWRPGMRAWPWNQGHAIANAHAACVELSRARVERGEVDLFLAQHLRSSLRTSAAVLPQPGARGDAVRR